MKMDVKEANEIIVIDIKYRTLSIEFFGRFCMIIMCHFILQVSDLVLISFSSTGFDKIASSHFDCSSHSAWNTCWRKEDSN